MGARVRRVRSSDARRVPGRCQKSAQPNRAEPCTINGYALFITRTQRTRQKSLRLAGLRLVRYRPYVLTYLT